MAEGKVAKVSLEIVAADVAVGRHDKQRLLLGPAESLDDRLVPRNAVQLLSRKAVKVNGRLGGYAGLVGLELGVVAP